MTWFKLDDAFHSHPKVLEAGNEAIGLYVRCGSYCAQHLTDGFVPSGVVSLYGSTELADRLVLARLWRPVDGGWRMHDYLTYNPSRQQVEVDREAAALRQRRARERKAAAEASRHAVTHALVTNTVTSDVTDDESDDAWPSALFDASSVTHTNGSNGQNGHSKAHSGEAKAPEQGKPESRHAVTHAQLTEAVTEDVTPPSHSPVPSRTSSGSTSSTTPRSRGCRLPEDFEVTDAMKAWAGGRVPDVNLERETEKFSNFFASAPGAKGLKLDWIKTWRNWLLEADDRLPRHLRSVPAPASQPSVVFAELLRKGDAKKAGQVCGISWQEPTKPPGDPTPTREWLHSRRTAFIDEHRDRILAALKATSRGTG